ncbi:delta and Notch-like epidermal growth factor-related receptor [Frankliniella occidentalis]|uniref:Delta and Notch-like epidermal growth factor-related receptor n=1 Tax=Frankliniella occidentalis TaxID=133901 RepID=A0A9C6TWA1_FRAOC|nr:delta and Notch-like epidermal growth factor-related receptor [Frankliniella occidentalis]
MADQPYVVEVPHFPSDLDAKLGSLDCVVPPLPPQSILWRANQTHELELPLTHLQNGIQRVENCATFLRLTEFGSTAKIYPSIIFTIMQQFGNLRSIAPQAPHQPQEAVYGVTREEMAGCDVAQGLLLDITPLPVDGKMLLALYDKDLSDGDNFLVILSERWAPGRCVRLHVLMKSDNCGENQDCSGKGVCYSKDSMEGFECQCCPGYLGPHCEERDACLPSPCLNQGICLDVSQGHEDTQFSCLCPYGFTGDRCEVVTDPCDSEPCRNGGSCRRSARNGTQWWCQCAPGFHGVQCERPVLALAAPEDPVVVAPATQVAAVVVAPAASPCVPSPCKYGLCISKGGQASCYCQPGFTGKRCDLQFRMCGSMPCLNGGDCVDVVDGFTCKCGPGYSGERCENKVPLCHDKSCRAGQECVDLGNTITCRCPVGTSPPDCKPTPAPPKPCSSSPCRHGGTCYNSDRGFYCACRPGYTGTTCNEEAILEEIPAGSARAELAAMTEERADVRFHLRPLNVAAATLCCALLIAVVTVATCHCRVHETYKRCLAVPCGRDGEDAMQAALTSKSTRGQPLLDSLREPSFPGSPSPRSSPTSKTAPLLDASDIYYALDFSDSQSSPLIQ